MMGRSGKSRSDLLTTIRASLIMLLVCLVLTWPPQAISQQTTEELQKGTISRRKSVSKLPGSVATPSESGDQTPEMAGERPPDEPIWMEFALDWTNCQIHRVNTDSAIVIILSGNVSSSNSIYWNLFTTSPQPGELPYLYFMEDVLGRTGPEFGTNIPLTWEIALDGGSFNPMTTLPDNILLVTFPSGDHTFQVRITGDPQSYQGDGYYQLLMGQMLISE